MWHKYYCRRAIERLITRPQQLIIEGEQFVSLRLLSSQQQLYILTSTEMPSHSIAFLPKRRSESFYHTTGRQTTYNTASNYCNGHPWPRRLGVNIRKERLNSRPAWLLADGTCNVTSVQVDLAYRKRQLTIPPPRQRPKVAFKKKKWFTRLHISHKYQPLQIQRLLSDFNN
jgi:hypothetical protein